MKLYQLTDDYEKVLGELYDDETGEVSETSLSKLNAIGDALENKAIALASFIKNMEAESAAISLAKEAMGLREKRIKDRMEWLKSYLLNNMERTGKTEISCPYFLIKLKKNPVSTEILNEFLLPEKYKKEKLVTTVDKNKIKADIQNGIEVPGATLVQKTKLDIR
jgi:hypothetical protein